MNLVEVETDLKLPIPPPPKDEELKEVMPPPPMSPNELKPVKIIKTSLKSKGIINLDVSRIY